MENDKDRAWTFRVRVIDVLIIGFLFFIIAAVSVPTFGVGIRSNKEAASAAQAHNLAIAAFSYSNDNNQTYPFGTSSMEIFQMLYDGKYLTQPGDVFLKPKAQSFFSGFFPGKVLYSGGSQFIHLKAENVSWDFVTQTNSGVIGTDPTDLPLLFSEVDTDPNWKAGVNNVTITASDPWGTDGVTMCTLDQHASFVRPGTVPGQVPLTQPSFTPDPSVTYITRKP